MGATDSTGSTSHKGKIQPDKGKIQPDKGEGSGNGHAILGAVTHGAACVVLRASVETFGPAGDAELNFHVKWPGTTLAAAEGSTDKSTNGQNGCADGGIDASGNLYLPATHPVSPKRD